MSGQILYQRLLNKANKPIDEEIEKAIGEKAQLWHNIHDFIKTNYDFTPELVYFTKKYGWAIRYRKSGKTLCYFFPEHGAFSVLMVLGNKEAERADSIKSDLNENVKSVFETTEQLRDGRWLWIRVLTDSDVESVKLMLQAKRKTKI